MKGTLSSDKNEILFQEFGVNYNNELPIFRKGTILMRKTVPAQYGRTKSDIVNLVDDLIGDRFWIENTEIFGETYAEQLKNSESPKHERREQI